MGHFFQDKATEYFLDPGIAPGLLNEDRTGRTLDTLYGAGVTEVFLEVARKTAGPCSFPYPVEALYVDCNGHSQGHESVLERYAIGLRRLTLKVTLVALLLPGLCCIMNGMGRDSRTPFLMVLGTATWLFSLAFFGFRQASVIKEHPLPERVVSLPAPKPLLDFAKAQAETGRLVVYAKEPMPFDSSENKGSYSYVLYGYLGASEPLNAPVHVYIRAKDPGRDPACEVFVAPLVVQREVVDDSAVYVCGEGQNDLRVAWVEFAGTNLSSFRSSKGAPLRGIPQERCEVDASLLRERFWIGIGWNLLFPHPLTFSFSDAIAYGPLIPAILPRSAYACQFR